MRPTKRPQSALRYPLNHILGTEAAVRVLRVVLLSDIPIGISELARRAELQASGVARVCTRLEDLGVIEAVGRGAHGRQYRRAQRLAFASQLVALFSEERNRAQQIIADLRSAVHNLSRAAWIEGPVALGTDRPGDVIVVGIVVEPGEVERARVQAWRHLLHVQQKHDLTIELNVLTMADLKTAGRARHAELDRVLLLAGPAPLDLVRAASPPRKEAAPRVRHHGDLDARSRELARAIADRVRRDPSIVEDAKRFLERRIPSASPAERLELEEWQGILDSMSIPRLCRFLVRDDARATRLRQSLPFLGVLSAKERKQLVHGAANA